MGVKGTVRKVSNVVLIVYVTQWIMTLVWTVLFWPSIHHWKDSVPWVNFQSWYANWATHSVGIVTAWVLLRQDKSDKSDNSEGCKCQESRSD